MDYRNYGLFVASGWLTYPSENDGVRQWVSDDIPCMKWKIKVMFQTINQEFCISINQYIQYIYHKP